MKLKSVLLGAVLVTGASGQAHGADLGAWIGQYQGSTPAGEACRLQVAANSDGGVDFHLTLEDGSWLPFWNLSRDLLPVYQEGSAVVTFHVPRRCGMGCTEGDFEILLGGGVPLAFSAELTYFYGFKKSVSCAGLSRAE